MRIELGGTDWAELKEVGELRRADRKALNRAIVYEIDSETKRPLVRASMDDDMADAVLALVVKDWSLPLPLPSRDIKSLDVLTLEQDEALREGIKAHIAALQGREAPAADNPGPTPGSAS